MKDFSADRQIENYRIKSIYKMSIPQMSDPCFLSDERSTFLFLGEYSAEILGGYSK